MRCWADGRAIRDRGDDDANGNAWKMAGMASSSHALRVTSPEREGSAVTIVVAVTVVVFVVAAATEIKVEVEDLGVDVVVGFGLGRGIVGMRVGVEWKGGDSEDDGGCFWSSSSSMGVMKRFLCLHLATLRAAARMFHGVQWEYFLVRWKSFGSIGGLVLNSGCTHTCKEGRVGRDMIPWRFDSPTLFKFRFLLAYLLNQTNNVF